MKIRPIDRIQPGADGYYEFACPGCHTNHSIPLIKGSENQLGWGWNGSVDLPTISPSIFVNRGRSNPTKDQCHSFVRDGRIEFLGDCSHHLAGQTVTLLDIA